MHEVVVEDGVVELVVRSVPAERLQRVASSGKLRHIMDRRCVIMSAFTLSEIIEHARARSPFYKELYRDVLQPELGYPA